MYRKMITDKINEQKEVYEKALAGDLETVRYKKRYSKEWGVSDEHWINRLRLAYYLIFNNIYNEELTLRLFEEEVIDRETDDFQGIGETLNILTVILNRFNDGGKYDELFERAKYANFDCSLGYEAEDCSFNNDISTYDIKSCIYLANDMDYPELEAELVDMYKATITELTPEICETMICYNINIKRQADSEPYYLKLFEWNKNSKNDYKRRTAYLDLFRFYVSVGDFEKAYTVYHSILSDLSHEELTRYKIDDFLIYCCDMLIGLPSHSAEIWDWLKPYIQSTDKFGKLYKQAIKAAETVGDEYAENMKEEYEQWKIKNHMNK